MVVLNMKFVELFLQHLSSFYHTIVQPQNKLLVQYKNDEFDWPFIFRNSLCVGLHRLDYAQRRIWSSVFGILQI